MTTTTKNVRDLTPDDVVSVYSGRPGCCCGCRGTHTANPAHLAEAEARRGYHYRDKHVNGWTVRIVLNCIVRAAEAGEAVVRGDGYVAWETPTCLRIAYLR